jgi:hypothetical protein
MPPTPKRGLPAHRHPPGLPRRFDGRIGDVRVIGGIPRVTGVARVSGIAAV